MYEYSHIISISISRYRYLHLHVCLYPLDLSVHLSIYLSTLDIGIYNIREKVTHPVDFGIIALRSSVHRTRTLEGKHHSAIRHIRLCGIVVKQRIKLDIKFHKVIGKKIEMLSKKMSQYVHVHKQI